MTAVAGELVWVEYEDEQGQVRETALMNPAQAETLVEEVEAAGRYAHAYEQVDPFDYDSTAIADGFARCL